MLLDDASLVAALEDDRQRVGRRDVVARLEHPGLLVHARVRVEDPRDLGR